VAHGFPFFLVALLGIVLGSMILPVHAQELYSLPIGARSADGGIDSETILTSISLNGQGQSVAVSPGQTVTGSVTFQIWSSGGPGIKRQAFFIASWSPDWPPVSSDYFPLYDGKPGDSPGVVQTTDFWFAAPSTRGTYYLWFASGAEYSMTNAVNKFTSSPGLPAHARILVDSTCPDDQYWSGSECVCPAGKHWNGQQCVQCSDDQIWDGSRCVCPSGQEWNGQQCVTIPSTCSGGQYWDGSRCVCPSGQEWNGQQCVTRTPSGCRPSLTLFSSQVGGSGVTLNGVTRPCTPGTSITRIHWDWGDGGSEDHWFPASHTYGKGGTYKICVTSYQSDGLSTEQCATVIIPCTGDAVNVLESCPDGTWRHRQVCRNGAWTDEYQTCRVCNEGDIRNVVMCPDGVNWKQREVCRNNQWANEDNSQSCPCTGIWCDPKVPGLIAICVVALIAIVVILRRAEKTGTVTETTREQTRDRKYTTSQIRDMLDALDERLAKGEITEETYKQLRDKWTRKAE